MSFVVSFIRFSAVQNFENRLRFDKVMECLKVGTFSETQCMHVFEVRASSSPPRLHLSQISFLWRPRLLR